MATAGDPSIAIIGSLKAGPDAERAAEDLGRELAKAGFRIVAQMTTVPQEMMSGKQASRLVPFGVVVGFIAGLTLDAVFRKLISSDVVELSAVEARKRSGPG
jgi:hypothetical protein